MLLASTVLYAAECRAAAATPEPAASHALLDVPYMAQTAELCGGAAVAMVLRYWGARDVFPQDFSPLVDPAAGGIPAGLLVSAVRDRGWQAHVVPPPDSADRASLRAEIDRGRPLVALIEVAPHAYHYVVIVGSTDGEVVVHDPARAPFRVLSWTEFDRAWSATGRWMLLILPPDGSASAHSAPPSTAASSAASVHADETPCTSLVDRSVQMALDHDAAGAESGLVAATALCPADSNAWRELAGLRFTQSRWTEARDLGLTAVHLAPDDKEAWQIVATSRYLLGDVIGALGSWNRTGEPRIDAIDISGAARIPQPVIVHATGLQPRQLLTPEAFERARRRLGALPAVSRTRMRYESLADGLTKVDIFIDEWPRAPHGWPAAANLAARAVVHDELVVDFADPLGVGDRETASWRWSSPRPRVALEVALPAPDWLPGVMSLDAAWERQSYEPSASSASVAPTREERRRVGLHLADWATSWLRWDTGVALDHLREHSDLETPLVAPRDYVAVESTIDLRLAADRVALVGSLGWWAPFAGGARFATGDLFAAWRSTIDTTRPCWSVMTETSLASHAAPLALWSGAGTGQARQGLLRAHPLLTDDVLTGPVFGRRVANASLEYARPIVHTFAGGVSLAGFVDSARAWQRANGLDTSPLFIDAGVGLRVHAPGSSGSIRIDLAHGLRGGGTTLSATWGNGWPR